MTYAELLRMRQNIRYMFYRQKKTELMATGAFSEMNVEGLADPSPSVIEAHLANCIAAGVDPLDIEFMATEMRNEQVPIIEVPVPSTEEVVS